jgi:hypothetical protein
MMASMSFLLHPSTIAGAVHFLLVFVIMWVAFSLTV